MKKELLLLSMLIFLGLLGFIVLKTALSEYYFTFYPAIPLYFVVLALLTLCALFVVKNSSPNNILTLYMSLKIIKLLLSIALVFLYLKKIGVQNLSFIVTFMSFYFIYLACETVYFSKILKEKSPSYHATKNE